MMDADFIERVFGQLPVVALVLWLFGKFREYENENRDRWIGYMRERDAEIHEQLKGSTAAQFAIGTEIKTLSTAVARLDARLQN